MIEIHLINRLNEPLSIKLTLWVLMILCLHRKNKHMKSVTLQMGVTNGFLDYIKVHLQ